MAYATRAVSHERANTYYDRAPARANVTTAPTSDAARFFRRSTPPSPEPAPAPDPRPPPMCEMHV